MTYRSTAVYGCFLVFGTFIFGLLRARVPKLTLLSVFATVGSMLSVFKIFFKLTYTGTYSRCLLRMLILVVYYYTADIDLVIDDWAAVPHSPVHPDTTYRQSTGLLCWYRRRINCPHFSGDNESLGAS